MAGSERNFEVDRLTIGISDPGFIMGVSYFGDVIGADSPIQTDVTGELTSLTITDSIAVDDDLFLRTETSTMTMSARYEDTPLALKDRTITVQYNGQAPLFKGTVISANRDVEVDPSREGDRKWTVTLAATTGDDRAVGYIIRQPTAASGSVEDTILTRVPYVSTVDVHPDLDLSDVIIAAGHEESMDVKELFTRIERIASVYIRSRPGDPSVVEVLPYDYGTAWEVSDQEATKASYTRLSLRDAQSAATSVQVSPMFRPADVPEEDPDLTVLRTVGGAVRNDKEFTIDVPWDVDKLQAAADAMPIKASLGEYLSALSLPFDDRLDFEDRPTRITAWLDGNKREAAVIDVTHTILPGSPLSGVPSTWRIDLTCAPLHLLTRESDA